MIVVQPWSKVTVDRSLLVPMTLSDLERRDVQLSGVRVCLRSNRLTNSDQIRHSNTYGEVVCFQRVCHAPYHRGARPIRAPMLGFSYLCLHAFDVERPNSV